MPFWKGVLIFNSGRNGWTETWYKEASTIAETNTPFQNFAGIRQKLCGKYATIEAIRIVSEDKPRVHQLVPTKFVVSAGAGLSDTPWNGILARVATSDRLYQRNVYLRGVVDELIQRLLDGTFNPAGNTDLTDPWEGFLSSARANGIRFKARLKTGEGATARDAGPFVRTADGFIQLPSAGFAGGPGSKVSFSEVTGEGSEILKGQHKVRSNGGGIMVLETKVGSDPGPGGWAVGKFRVVLPEYPLVYSGNPLRPTKRSTGRAFFVTRGRR